MNSNRETYTFVRAISGNHDNNWVAESFEAAVERIVAERTAERLLEIADLKQRIMDLESVVASMF
jgi:hypothetical protein